MATANEKESTTENEQPEKYTEKQGAEQDYFFDDLHVGVKARSQKEAREKAEKLAGKEDK